MARVSESLAGRAAVLELLPFSFAESGGQGEIAELLWNGLYPEPALRPRMRGLWISSYLRTYLERDVRQLLNVVDLAAFERVMALLAARHGQLVRRSEIARQAGVSEPTVKTWMGASSRRPICS